MRILPFIPLLLVLTVGLWAQTPQTRLSYEDRAGTTGHVLVLDGKSYGPYKEITSVTHSTSGTAGLFVVTKRDKTYIVAQGKETGPLAAGFDIDQNWVSDDGKVWVVTATHADDNDDAAALTQLWVNGKLYGPYKAVTSVEYAEHGGNWIATVQTGEQEFGVLLNGKSLGTFNTVNHIWMFPDGQAWGYATTDSDGKNIIVTQDKTYEDVLESNFEQMYPRNHHWALGFTMGEDQQTIIVDGKEFPGYLQFSGMTTTYTGRHWGFEAQKMSDSGDYPVVVIDGTEYIGEGLQTSSLGDQESFTWTVKDGAKVTVQVLTLP